MKILFEVSQTDIGKGSSIFQWQKGRGNYLALAGSNHLVAIYNRQGDQIAVIPLPGVCTSLDWDKDGEILSIAQDFNGILYLWNANTMETIKFDTGMKEGLSLSLWAYHSRLLAIGTKKGNLVLYNYRNRKKVPVLGKHSRKIHSGVWSTNNVLALAGDDKSITLSDKDGNNVSQSEVKLDVDKGSLRFSPDGNRLIAVCGSTMLYIFEIIDDTPLQLIFQTRYGDITANVWIDDSQIMLGFSKGFMVLISREKGAIGEEVFQTQNHKSRLSDLSMSPQLSLIASAGEHEIKLHEFQDLKEVYASYVLEDTNYKPDRALGTMHASTVTRNQESDESIRNNSSSYIRILLRIPMIALQTLQSIVSCNSFIKTLIDSINKVQWTDDGQLLTSSLKKGGLMTFLIQLPQLGCSYDTRVVYLTSLLQVTIANELDEDLASVIDCPIEPSFLAIGSSHLAIGMNNRVWFTNFMDSKKSFSERSYINSVTDISVNDSYSAVLNNGGIELHQIESTQFNMVNDGSNQRHPDERSFPDEGQNDVITTHVLTNDYLIYGTESGSIVYFYLDEWQFVNEYKHVVGITKVYPDSSGIRLVFTDDKSDAFLYNPINDTTIDVPDYPPSAVGLLWDMGPLEKHVFIIYDKEKILTYVYYRDTSEGPNCAFLESTDLPYNHLPLLLFNGELTCLNTTGKTKTIKLQSHNYGDEQDLSEDELKNSFQKSLNLCRLKDAWLFASAIDKVDTWSELANSALFHLDIELAIRSFQQTKNIAMVTSLQDIQDIEDRNLLVGYINMYKDNYTIAQDLFLKSSQPKAALEMRCDLLQWNQALELAKTLSEDRLPIISRQYAEQLEFVGDYGNSLIHYERAVSNLPQLSEHDEQCMRGLARTALHTGDVRRGIKLAQSSSDNALKLECAEILETLKLFSEAGLLYEQSENWEKSAQCYIRIKNWDKVGSCLTKVPLSFRLHAHYAKAREIDGHFKEAAMAYETAQEYDNAIRMYLDHLKQPEQAVRVVNESKSIEGAKMVANFFQKTGDYGSALQFLVISKCTNEAYQMAESHNQVDQYAGVIGDNGTNDDYIKIANYYEKNNEHFKAGVFFMKATEYMKSLDHLLMCPVSLFPEGDHINMAIKVVGLARKETLVQRLHSYLLGELDNDPKEAKFLFGMYLSLGQYPEASQTAILIAREDQDGGNYRNARDLLYQMYRDLKVQDIKIPTEMKQSLMLLHSYLLVKLQVKKGDHENAARLLLRVATNISKFPSHIVSILTSTVIECQRSGLNKSAFEYAAMLMRPEYRQHIDGKWKKKIESIVRKPDRNEAEDTFKPCPYCSFMLPRTRLDCPQCKNNIPYCILTGQHMIRTDWTECDKCEFPALYSEFKSFIESNGMCPLCGEECGEKDIKLMTEDQVQARLANQ